MAVDQNQEESDSAGATRQLQRTINVNGLEYDLVATARGGSKTDEDGTWAAGGLILEPSKVVVHSENGEEEISLDDPASVARDGILKAMTAIALVSFFVMTMVRLGQRRVRRGMKRNSKR